MRKRILICNLIVLIWVFVIFSNTYAAKANSRPDLIAESAMLMDFTTGKILYEKNPDLRRAPASTTKILTAIVALEHGDLRQIIAATPSACKIGGSSIWLSQGETHSLEDMLYGILLSSGNDASASVAENLAGSEKKFAEWMTEKAHAIGATSSSFKNSSGMPETGHYTTAHDLAVITRYALNNPTFSTMVKTKKKVITWPGKEYDRAMVNHNKLLWRYQYADGVKTGYTREAGKCLVASATRNGHRMIAVVLNSKQMYEDTEKMFDYGFENYQLLNIVSTQEKVGEVSVALGVKEEVPVLPNRTLTLLLPKGAEDNLKVNLELQKKLEAPVERLQQVGELTVQLGEKLIDTVPVVTAVEVPKKGLFQRFWDWVRKIIG